MAIARDVLIGSQEKNPLDMWDEIRLAAYIHKVRLDDPKVMPAAFPLTSTLRRTPRHVRKKPPR